MAVDSVGSSTSAQQLLYNRSNVAAVSEDLTMTDFYKLMAAEMQYQDPDNPMDTSQLMAQMVQTKMITALAQMTSISTTTYATSMLGNEVTVAEVDERGVGTGEYTKGKVTGVVLGDNPIVYVDGKAYSLSQIMSVGDVETLGDKGEEDSGNGDSGDAGDSADKVEGDTKTA